MATNNQKQHEAQKTLPQVLQTASLTQQQDKANSRGQDKTSNAERRTTNAHAKVNRSAQQRDHGRVEQRRIYAHRASNRHRAAERPHTDIHRTHPVSSQLEIPRRQDRISIQKSAAPPARANSPFRRFSAASEPRL